MEHLIAGVEYFAMNMLVNNTKTVGTGACAGCTTPVCIVLSSIKVTSATPANTVLLRGPINGTDASYMTWQGGGVPVTNLGTGCPQALIAEPWPVPTQNRTWGQVKALYR